MVGCDRHGGAVWAAACAPGPPPRAAAVRLAAPPAARRPPSRHPARAPRGRATCVDAAPALRPARGRLARPPPQPGGPRPAVRARAGLADRGHEGGRRAGAPPRHRPQARPRGRRRGQGGEGRRRRGPRRLPSRPRLTPRPPPRLAPRGARGLGGRARRPHGLPTRRPPCGPHEALRLPPSLHGLAHRRPRAAAPLTHALERVALVLVDGRERPTAPGRTRHRVRAGLGITAGGVGRRDGRCAPRGRPARDVVPRCATASRPLRRAPTGFEAAAPRRRRRETGPPGIPGHARASHPGAPVLPPHRVQHARGESDAEDGPLVRPGTRLLWLSGCTDRARRVAHRRRSAQGRVHFITTTHENSSVLLAISVFLAYTIAFNISEVTRDIW
jgi:hypothetical protein